MATMEDSCMWLQWNLAFVFLSVITLIASIVLCGLACRKNEEEYHSYEPVRSSDDDEDATIVGDHDCIQGGGPSLS